MCTSQIIQRDDIASDTAENIRILIFLYCVYGRRPSSVLYFSCMYISLQDRQCMHNSREGQVYCLQTLVVVLTCSD